MSLKDAKMQQLSSKWAEKIEINISIEFLIQNLMA